MKWGNPVSCMGCSSGKESARCGKFVSLAAGADRSAAGAAASPSAGVDARGGPDGWLPVICPSTGWEAYFAESLLIFAMSQGQFIPAKPSAKLGGISK